MGTCLVMHMTFSMKMLTAIYLAQSTWNCLIAKLMLDSLSTNSIPAQPAEPCNAMLELHTAFSDFVCEGLVA